MPGVEGRAKKGMAKKLQNYHRRLKVSDLYVQGFSTPAIAQQLSTPVRTVARDLQVLRERYIKNANINTEEALGRELACINLQERELWMAWEKSKARVEVLHVRRRVNSRPLDAKGKPISDAVETVEEKTVRESVGDLRIMEQITKLRDQKAKLLGLYKDINLTNVTQTFVGSNTYELYQQALLRVQADEQDIPDDDDNDNNNHLPIPVEFSASAAVSG